MRLRRFASPPYSKHLLFHTRFSGYDTQVDYASPDQQRINTEESFVLATALFPGEVWVLKEPGIGGSPERLQQVTQRTAKLAWEIEHVRILTQRDILGVPL